MKNTNGIKMLILSFAFAAVHLVASPMEWIVQPEERSVDERDHAIEILKSSIAADLAKQREQKGGWFSSKPVESVEAFFATNPATDVLTALLNAGEYKHAKSSLQSFLIRRNGDPAKVYAYRAALDFALNGSLPMIHAFVEYCINCIQSNRALMNQNFMNLTVEFMLMGFVAAQQVSLDAAGNDLPSPVLEALNFFKNDVLMAQFQVLFGESDEYFGSEYFQECKSGVLQDVEKSWSQNSSNLKQVIERLNRANTWKELFEQK